ncbi:V-type proton ATPase subunit F [Eucalyptus grandis]|uniref:V-type proton ATPase subunit F n=1 Tax=Eucalyptus grandis TaxID=71139 RepID=UPI00192EF206|nr:V-type proton ATPase subunit F [Eucalyptus grandis]
MAFSEVPEIYSEIIHERLKVFLATLAIRNETTFTAVDPYLGTDTVTGFLLAGVGNVDLRRKTNYLIVDSKTTVKAIEDTFKEFTSREDIAIVLISQYVANMIRFLVDSYNKPVPAILEIPSKDHPYDPAHDSVLSRVKYLFSAESVASGRR